VYYHNINKTSIVYYQKLTLKIFQWLKIKTIFLAISCDLTSCKIWKTHWNSFRWL